MRCWSGIRLPGRRTCAGKSPIRGSCSPPRPWRPAGSGWARAARHAWATSPALRDNYRHHRPNVERAIAQVASRGGRRLKLRYLGTAKNNAWLKTRTAALNLRNLTGRGLGHHGGAWVLA